MSDAELRDSMYSDIADVCKKFRTLGVGPAKLAGRLMAMALAGCEHSNITCDEVVALVQQFYGMKENAPPFAKA